jgi:hypothetical protein
LFPWLGHLLHLPLAVFFALPIVGCWLTAALLVQVLARELRDRQMAELGVALACGGDWFFTSTGWLGYFDAWIVLGLLSVAFVRSRWSLVLSCLTMPWIEERFLIVCPVCWALRSFVFRDEKRPVLALIGDALASAAGLLPFFIVRLPAVFHGGDVSSTGTLFDMFHVQRDWRDLLDGAVMGLRVMWIFVGAFYLLAWRLQPRLWTAAVLTVTALLFATSLLAAGDISRSASAFVPVGVVGLVVAFQCKPDLCRRTLPYLLAASCLLPAVHVVGGGRWSIYRFFDEMQHFNRPSVFVLDAGYYNSLATNLTIQGKFDAALSYFDMALKIDPSNKSMRYNRLLTLRMKGDYDAVIQGVNDLLKEDPANWDAYLTRAICRERKGQPRFALSDYLEVRRRAPPDWPGHAEVEIDGIKRLQDKGVTPAKPPN